MRTAWIEPESLAVVMQLLTPCNRLAIEVSARYGMRIGDVLALTRSQVQKGRFSYHEQKTGKSRRVAFSADVAQRLMDVSGERFIFEHRLDTQRHRTRQAVYSDIRRATKALRLSANVGCHSARKVYSVNSRLSGKSLEDVRKLLNHSDPAVTMIYYLADELSKRRKGGA